MLAEAGPIVKGVSGCGAVGETPRYLAWYATRSQRPRELYTSPVRDRLRPRFRCSPSESVNNPRRGRGICFPMELE